MPVDSAHQPCPHCARPTVLVTDRLESRRLHLGTWRAQCGPPELAWLEAEMVGTTQVQPHDRDRHPSGPNDREG